MGAGAMSYVAESDTGHMKLMHARLKRLHDSMAARGASPAALARLPRLPRWSTPLDAGLPPVVLATARNSTTDIYQQAAAQLAWRRKLKREG